jgi:hypothetical protein
LHGCRSWPRCTAHRLQLKFTCPEPFETMRSVYATTTLVNRCFLQMGPEADGVTPTLFFNYDEIMVSSDFHCKVVITVHGRLRTHLGKTLRSSGSTPSTWRALRIQRLQDLE